MTVTVRDSAGNPLPGASFNLKRGTALNRAKAAYDASADDLTIIPVEPTGGNVNLVWGWDAGSSEDRERW